MGGFLKSFGVSCVLLGLAGLPAAAASYDVVYSFTAGNDGGFVAPGLASDGDGNFYGVAGKGENNAGVIYRFTRAGVQTPLHAFGEEEGYAASGDLLFSDGKIYGTNRLGASDCNCGAVFQMSTSGKLKVLYRFKGGVRGGFPIGKLARDADGTLYGVAGAGSSDIGVVFRLKANGDYKVLHSFAGGADGSYPSGVVLAPDGTLYGSTSQGGASGHGEIFKISASGKFSVIYNFDRTHGESPSGDLIMDKDGAIYGVTSGGGGNLAGTVFRLSKKRKLTVLFSFAGTAGRNPVAGVAMDAAGTIYGTTSGGGLPSCDCGVVYKLSPGGAQKVLHAFEGAPDGWDPVSPPAIDKNGDLFGTTYYGGDRDAGAIYKIAR